MLTFKILGDFEKYPIFNFYIQQKGWDSYADI